MMNEKIPNEKIPNEEIQNNEIPEWKNTKVQNLAEQNPKWKKKYQTEKNLTYKSPVWGYDQNSNE
jgi:hypothetical protein